MDAPDRLRGAQVKIEALYAWVCVAPDGGEGAVATWLGGQWFPLIGADRERIESLRGAAQAAKSAGYPVRLVRFDRLTVLEEP